MITKDRVYSRLHNSGNVPALPETLLSLLVACDDDTASLHDLAAIISRDPSLSFRVLQLVNSAYHSSRHSFSSLEQAVIYLGASTIKNLAVTTSIHQVFMNRRFPNLSQFTSENFWRHSMLCAIIARSLAQQIGLSDPDEAYISGLLHDIGKVLLVSAFPREYAEQLKHNQELVFTPEREAEVLGTNHGEAGSWLIRKWQLNSLIADAVEYHHEPIEQVQGGFPLVKIIYLANLLATENSTSEKTKADARMLFDLGADDISTIVSKAKTEVEQIAQEMQIVALLPPEPVLATDDTDQAAGPGQSSETTQPTTVQQQEPFAQMAIDARIKDVSLLTSLLERLVQAGDVENILMAFEQSLTLLFDIDRILFFLVDNEELLLNSRTSAANPLSQNATGLTLPARESQSCIVQSYRNKEALIYLTAGQEEHASLADQQLLAILRCPKAVIIPLVAKNWSAGVAVLGLPHEMAVLTEDDSRLIQAIARHVALCLHLQRVKSSQEVQLKAERLATLAMTSKKLAHEINNPLGIIGNYLVTVKLKLLDKPEVVDELAIIDEEIQRISTMVSKMESYAQAPFSDFKPIDINALIGDIVRLTQPALFNLPEKTLRFQPAPGLPLIQTSQDAIKQVLINLLKNSAEAISDKGCVTISSQLAPAGEDLPEGGIAITVSDTGPGLPDSVRKNLYAPFTTTKQDDHSGLGLSIVQRAVTDMGGTLLCTTDKNTGTVFTIRLPGIVTTPED